MPTADTRHAPNKHFLSPPLRPSGALCTMPCGLLAELGSLVWSVHPSHPCSYAKAHLVTLPCQVCRGQQSWWSC